MRAMNRAALIVTLDLIGVMALIWAAYETWRPLVGIVIAVLCLALARSLGD